MKITYAIAGFVTGLMIGLLAGLVEMKIFRGNKYDTVLPFIIGITVLVFIITGISTGIKIARRKLNQ